MDFKEENNVLVLSLKMNNDGEKYLGRKFLTIFVKIISHSSGFAREQEKINKNLIKSTFVWFLM